MVMSHEAIVNLLEEDDFYREVVATYLLKHRGCPSDRVSTKTTCPLCLGEYDWADYDHA